MMPASGDPAVIQQVPLISVVLAIFNGARFIEGALASVLAQTVREIEVICVDDCSTDDSVARVAALAKRDPRIRMLRTPVNGGPAAARNHALDIASGQWIAVMDSDDLMHPDRLAKLVTAGERDRADIVADDLLIFDEDDRVPPFSAFGDKWKACWVDAVTYVRSNCLYSGRDPALGYLKPLFRAAVIQRAQLRYDPSLRVAEDYDFTLRLLANGARFRIYPELTYFYRKHTASISHRLSQSKLLPMLAADDALRADLDLVEPELIKALDQRRKSILRAIEFDKLIVTLKQRKWRAAVEVAVHRPDIVRRLWMPTTSRLRRWLRAPRKPPGAGPSVCIISRQRLVGNVNGSSVYLLSLCAAFRDEGFDVHLVCPSPAVFGRWPALLLRGEMAIFSSLHIRGGWRIGRVILARDPRILVTAALTVFDRLLRKFGLSSSHLVPNAPYSIAVPWLAADFLYVARHARRNADVLLADYAFLTEAIPYALRPDAPSAVVMHDLFCSRSAQFDLLHAADSVALIDEAHEIALLARADAVIAIQAEEAAFVHRHLPDTRVIVAPMAIVPAVEPQPGVDGRALFVGSNTAPNVLGLRWFIDHVWPGIQRVVPGATLTVAGNVARAFDGENRNGVRFVGRVPDLAPLYREAAVVISPLHVGSGLKIKLIEAFGHGKATVVTSVSLQGIELLAGDAVCLANDPDAFAMGVITLLRDTERRLELGHAALHLARQHFSPQACYGELLNFAAAALHSAPE